MSIYLLEIGTEELPASFITEAQIRLKELLSEALKAANLPFSEIITMATPRRLTCIVSGLASKQETTSKKVKGPPVKDSFDENNRPLMKAEKFAEKHKLTVDKLDQEDMGGTVYLVANLTIEGLKAQEVLGEIMPKVISQLSGERLMRWGSSELKFSRPIRWIVSLLDSEVVPFSMGDGINAGRQSFGHRILAPAAVTIDTAQNYGEALKKSFVIVCPDERRDLIKTQVTELAAKLKGRAKLLKGPLLEEVVNLTEWPCAVSGDFATEYLELPDTLIETIMVHHQRYFPVATEAHEKNSTNGTSVRANNLLPHFITISNNDRESAKDSIKKGNERVLKARLADGRFFYFDDQKIKFFDRKASLGQLTFQEGLGSYLDKTNRLVKLANELAAQLNLEARLKICLERAAELCKVDLVTNLVRELPELQGYVGSWYAESEKEPPDVVHAIASHYSPRSTDDGIAGDEVGRFTAVIDKIDHVVGLFALGKKPSGSSDPFALRRQAQGLVDTIVDGLAKYPVNVSALINSLLDSYEPLLSNSKKGFEKDKVYAEVSDFILQRLRGKLLDLAFSKEAVESVLASRDPLQNLPDVVTRCRALDELIKSADGLPTMKAGVRVANILKPDSHQTADPKLFTLDAEKNLWNTFNEDVASKWSGLEPKLPTSIEEYKKLLDLLKNLAKPVDAFFDGVLVDDPDQEKRKNRHGLLYTIDRYFKCIGDFRKLRTLLPS